MSWTAHRRAFGGLAVGAAVAVVACAGPVVQTRIETFEETREVNNSEVLQATASVEMREGAPTLLVSLSTEKKCDKEVFKVTTGATGTTKERTSFTQSACQIDRFTELPVTVSLQVAPDQSEQIYAQVVTSAPDGDYGSVIVPLPPQPLARITARGSVRVRVSPAGGQLLRDEVVLPAVEITGLLEAASLARGWEDARLSTDGAGLRAFAANNPSFMTKEVQAELARAGTAEASAALGQPEIVETPTIPPVQSETEEGSAVPVRPETVEAPAAPGQPENIEAPAPGQPENMEASAPAPGQPENVEASAPAPEQPENVEASAPAPEQPENMEASAPAPGQPETVETPAAAPGQPETVETPAAASGQPETVEAPAPAPGQPEIVEAPTTPRQPETAAVPAEPVQTEAEEAPAAEPEQLDPVEAMSQKLVAMASASPFDIGASLAALREVEGKAELPPSVEQNVSALACRLCSAASPKSEAYLHAFRILRAKETPEVWPCSADETNAIWSRFGRFFDAQVEIRADFEGAFDYLHRWDEVLGRFRDIAQHVGAEAATTELELMRAKVLRAIRKLPEEDRCATAKNRNWSCERACTVKLRKRTKECAKQGDASCVEEVEASQAQCVECCFFGGRGCRRIAPFVCASPAEAESGHR